MGASRQNSVGSPWVRFQALVVDRPIPSPINAWAPPALAGKRAPRAVVRPVSAAGGGDQTVAAG